MSHSQVSKSSIMRHVYLCRVAGNSVWSHIAGVTVEMGFLWRHTHTTSPIMFRLFVWCTGFYSETIGPYSWEN